MIKSFCNSETEKIFEGKFSKKYPPEIQEKALIKLTIINAAVERKDLKSPPGNRLEKLKGNMAEYSSIRINNQWRITFRWKAGDAYEVCIEDYH